MPQPTESPGRDVDRRLEEIAGQIGALLIEAERLRAQRDPGTPAAEPSDVEGEPPRAASEPTAREQQRTVEDRITYLRTARESMYRLLYVVDFTLVTERIDGQVMRGARKALVDGIDAADACLLLDGVHELVMTDAD